MAMQNKKVTDTNSTKSSLGHHPFDSLKGLVKSKTLQASAPPGKKTQEKSDPIPVAQTEDLLFREAMQGVRPIAGEYASGGPVPLKTVERPERDPEDDALLRLTRLVNRGEGFIVSDTPEYMEGTGYNVRQEFARRLHRGDFSIQAHMDLHGMNVEHAQEEFESFMKASYLAGKKALLIIHGRGLSSPGEAILKNKVHEWLSHSYWRKRVFAFASAQSHDGGAGATYVLLRDRPVSKRSGKIKPAV